MFYLFGWAAVIAALSVNNFWQGFALACLALVGFVVAHVVGED